ncbi:MAG TPA: hypothetical protein EYG69_02425 [Campylobacterales bacterium]|nr:hypothetical protein [Campylobacterales bacterium]
MKAKQKKIRVFDIIVESEENFFSYMEKNLILLKDYLLLVSGEVTPRVTDFLSSNGLCFVLVDSCSIKTKTTPIPSSIESKPVAQEPKTQTITEVVTKEKIVTTKVINKPVRSGAVVEYDGDIVVFGRVNSGAKIVSEANIQLFDKVDGIVEANGEFMILKSIDKGYVVFNGDILEKDDFDGSLKKVIKNDDGYTIEAL